MRLRHQPRAEALHKLSRRVEHQDRNLAPLPAAGNAALPPGVGGRCNTQRLPCASTSASATPPNESWRQLCPVLDQPKRRLLRARDRDDADRRAAIASPMVETGRARCRIASPSWALPDLVFSAAGQRRIRTQRCIPQFQAGDLVSPPLQILGAHGDRATANGRHFLATPTKGILGSRPVAAARTLSFGRRRLD